MKTIFLVDDSATILLSISSILTKADLLITDLNMPGMNGIEFIKEVRKLPACRFMPILFLTTESEQSKRLEAKAAGASGWIVKPATADQLLNTIKLVLR
ncbi:response regulator [Oryzomicrobium sp.]|uniref:response regulator n=1 Tax=Oryzomicrobium sp. TaxID=1911578 RepID=UPI0025D32563|nr:response regulator [Oryzomicrobium sp.]MCE1243874.1 response regulator [Oryzomicrobium sp.]